MEATRARSAASARNVGRRVDTAAEGRREGVAERRTVGRVPLRVRLADRLVVAVKPR